MSDPVTRFVLKRLINLRRTLGAKVMARTAANAGLPIELPLAALRIRRL